MHGDPFVYAILTAPGYLGCCLAAAFLVNIFEDETRETPCSRQAPTDESATIDPRAACKRRSGSPHLAKPRTLRSVKRRQRRAA